MKNNMFFSGLIGLLFMTVAFVNVDSTTVADVQKEVITATCNGFLNINVPTPSSFEPPLEWELRVRQSGDVLGSTQSPGLHDVRVEAGTPFEVCIDLKNNVKEVIITVDYDFCGIQGTLTYTFPPGNTMPICFPLETNGCN